jgi:hypothetical protein
LIHAVNFSNFIAFTPHSNPPSAKVIEPVIGKFVQIERDSTGNFKAFFLGEFRHFRQRDQISSNRNWTDQNFDLNVSYSNCNFTMNDSSLFFLYFQALRPILQKCGGKLDQDNPKVKKKSKKKILCKKNCTKVF